MVKLGTTLWRRNEQKILILVSCNHDPGCMLLCQTHRANPNPGTHSNPSQSLGHPNSNCHIHTDSKPHRYQPAHANSDFHLYGHTFSWFRRTLQVLSSLD